MSGAPEETEIVLESPTDLLLSFRLHRFGQLDPSFRLESRRLLQAVATPLGPAVFEVAAIDGDGPRASRFQVRGHGPGARHLVERAPRILGTDDRPERFVPVCTTGKRLVRRAPGLRLTRGADPLGLLVNLIFQQRVAWRDAARAHLHLVRRHGRPAPGNFGLVVPPDGRGWRKVPSSDFSALDVDGKRAETIRRVGQVGGHIDAFFEAPAAEVERKLSGLSGLGPWTVQNFLGFALGAPDALPTGDYDLPHRIAHAFRGHPRSNDAEMIRILEPYRGQRWRIVRLLEESGLRLPRFGPRIGNGRPRRASSR